MNTLHLNKDNIIEVVEEIRGLKNIKARGLRQQGFVESTSTLMGFVLNTAIFEMYEVPNTVLVVRDITYDDLDTVRQLIFNMNTKKFRQLPTILQEFLTICSSKYELGVRDIGKTIQRRGIELLDIAELRALIAKDMISDIDDTYTIGTITCPKCGTLVTDTGVCNKCVEKLETVIYNRCEAFVMFSNVARPFQIQVLNYLVDASCEGRLEFTPLPNNVPSTRQYQAELPFPEYQVSKLS